MRLPNNPLTRMQESYVRAAKIAMSGAPSTAGQSTDSATVGANDGTTGEWKPYGVFDRTPISQFLVRA